MEATGEETKRAYRRRGAKRDPFKRARFIEELSRPGVTQAEAAMAAGYADTHECAKVRGSQLMSDPGIRAEVEARRGELLGRAGDEAGQVFLVYAPGPGLYRLCFAPGNSVAAMFDRLLVESAVSLRLLWELPGRRAALAVALAPFSGRVHHGVWYRLAEAELTRLAEAVETYSLAPSDKV
jgi:hypothetical protein